MPSVPIDRTEDNLKPRIRGEQKSPALWVQVPKFRFYAKKSTAHLTCGGPQC